MIVIGAILDWTRLGSGLVEEDDWLLYEILI